MPALKDRVAVVTGGSRGIGRAIAALAAERGASVYILHARAGSADEAVAQIAKAGFRAKAMQADVSDADAVEKAAAAIAAEAGRIDIWVNNAGLTADNLLLRMSPDEWSRVIATNLTGCFLGMKAASRRMLKQRSGRIVSITSVVGLHGNAGQANYAASKAGIVGLTKSAAKELASRGITVNAVAPGYIETDMTAAMQAAARAKLQGMIPAERLGTPKDVAEVVCFLASDSAAYVTGQVIQVDGGLFI